MKKIPFFLIFIYVLRAQGQNVPISLLPAADTVGAPDFYPVVQDGHYKKASVGLISSQLDSTIAVTIHDSLISNPKWSITGNSGTVPFTNYIGTSDTAPCVILSGGHLTSNDNASFIECGIGSHSTANYITLTTVDSFRNAASYINASSGGMQLAVGTVTGLPVSDSSSNIFIDSTHIYYVFRRNPSYYFPFAVTPYLVELNTSLQIQDGTQGAGNVLTSNANGVASWQNNGVFSLHDSISSTQILNSFSSPVTLIPAPGPGYFIHIISVSFNYQFISAGYATTESGIIEGDPTNILINMSPISQSQNIYGPAANVTTNQLVSFENQPVQFYSATANPTGGGGYVIIYVDYRIESY